MTNKTEVPLLTAKLANEMCLILKSKKWNSESVQAISDGRAVVIATADLEAKDAEIERLTNYLQKANAQTEHFERQWYLVGDERDRLRAENEALRADAERYQWIKSRPTPDSVLSKTGYWQPCDPVTLDQRIDAARSQS